MEKDIFMPIKYKFIGLVQKHIKSQFKDLNMVYDVPEKVLESALTTAEFMGWKSGKPQCISQVILYRAAKKEGIDIPYKAFYRFFNISKKTFNKWNAVMKIEGL